MPKKAEGLSQPLKKNRVTHTTFGKTPALIQIRVKDIQHILLDCKRGKPLAQKSLYDMYKAEMLGICRRYARDESVAKDMFQEGFVRIFKDLAQFDPEKGQFRSWIRKVMVNSALQHIRAHKKWNTYLELNGVGKEDLSYYDKVLDRLSLDEIHQLIRMMPEGYRVVFNMYAVEGYSHKEIAETIGCSEGTSKSQLFKAKQWLRQQLQKLDPSIGIKYGKQVAQG